MDEFVSDDATSVLAKLGSFFWELIKVFLIAVAIIIPIRFFLVQPFFVRGASMEPNFQDGEYLIVDELSYRFRSPSRGEVVVFRYPDNPSQFFIKRIVGLPGDMVIVEDGQVTIQNREYQQGVILDESSYLAPTTRTSGTVSYTLGTNEYFVLGDNRPASSDSRNWGALQKELIIGRAWIRAFPVDRLDFFAPERPGFVSVQ
ncbi:MAG: signal peptidase I [Candidatus Andersenbacteria bacterium]